MVRLQPHGMECNGTIGEDVATRLCTTTTQWEIGIES